MKCDSSNQRISSKFCVSLVENCEAVADGICKQCVTGYFLVRTNICEKLIELDPLFQPTIWRNIYVLDLKVQSQDFLDKLIKLSPSPLSFSLNEKSLINPKFTLSVQHERELLIAMEFQQSVARLSLLELNIKPHSWMTTNTSRILKKYKFSLKITTDFFFCGEISFYNESKN